MARSLKHPLQVFLLVFLPVFILFCFTSSIIARERVIYSINTPKGCYAALTFDDGPHPVYTMQILNILDEYQVKATFFMIGERMKMYPEVVKEVLARGHVIANHTYSHPYPISAFSSKEIRFELEQWEKAAREFKINNPRLFRPPRGLIGGKVLEVAEQKGYKTVLWTVCADNRKATTSNLMAQRVKKHMKPGGIILLHDGTFDSRWKDVWATEAIIAILSLEGYEFLTLPELLALNQEDIKA